MVTDVSWEPAASIFRVNQAWMYGGRGRPGMHSNMHSDSNQVFEDSAVDPFTELHHKISSISDDSLSSIYNSYLLY
jgi:hypothetical protein